jgi:hypothetical protein
VSFLVILVGGTDCMGAYLIKPVWSAYGTPEFSFAAPAAAPAPASFAIWSTVAGTVLPAAVAAVMKAGSVVPVMPVMVKRSEKVVMVPPDATLIILK